MILNRPSYTSNFIVFTSDIKTVFIWAVSLHGMIGYLLLQCWDVEGGAQHQRFPGEILFDEPLKTMAFQCARHLLY